MRARRWLAASPAGNYPDLQNPVHVLHVAKSGRFKRLYITSVRNPTPLMLRVKSNDILSILVFSCRKTGLKYGRLPALLSVAHTVDSNGSRYNHNLSVMAPVSLHNVDWLRTCLSQVSKPMEVVCAAGHRLESICNCNYFAVLSACAGQVLGALPFKSSLWELAASVYNYASS